MLKYVKYIIIVTRETIGLLKFYLGMIMGSVQGMKCTGSGRRTGKSIPVKVSGVGGS